MCKCLQIMCANIMSLGICFIFKKVAPRQSCRVTVAWYSVKIRVIFGVRFERRKVDLKANLHENWNMQSLF